MGKWSHLLLPFIVVLYNVGQYNIWPERRQPALSMGVHERLVRNDSSKATMAAHLVVHGDLRRSRLLPQAGEIVHPFIEILT